MEEVTNDPKAVPVAPSPAPAVVKEKMAFAIVGVVLGVVAIIAAISALLIVLGSKSVTGTDGLPLAALSLFVFGFSAYFLIPFFGLIGTIFSVLAVVQSRHNARKAGIAGICLIAVAVILIIIAAVSLGIY